MFFLIVVVGKTVTHFVSNNWSIYVAECYDVHEAKIFFEPNYPCIYWLFHEGFTNVEQSLAQRGNAKLNVIASVEFVVLAVVKIVVGFTENMLHSNVPVDDKMCQGKLWW